MLKAVQNDYYYKNGGKVYTYKVLGTAAEIAEYVAIESARRNISPEQVQKAPDGSPIMWVSEQNEYRNGRIPQPSYSLRKNFRGDGYNIDTTATDNANAQKLNDLVLQSQATILAQRRLGIGVERPGARTTTTTATPAPAEQDAVEELIAGQTGEQEPAVEHAEAGNETLAN